MKSQISGMAEKVALGAKRKIKEDTISPQWCGREAPFNHQKIASCGRLFVNNSHTFYVGGAPSQNAAGDYSVSHSSVPGSKFISAFTDSCLTLTGEVVRAISGRYTVRTDSQAEANILTDGSCL